MVEITEAMLIIMAVMIAISLVQTDLEETSIIVFHEHLATDMGMEALFPRVQH